MKSKKNPILIAPSILSGDFGNLSEEAKRIEASGADAIHIDIMDGQFVPNLTLGPKAVAAIRRATKLFLDVHIMIYNPFDFVEALVEAGADRITFHFEATENVEETLNYIRRCNVEAGLAFRPETSKEMIVPYLKSADLILLMTVNPGFGGQAFLPQSLDKIEFVSQAVKELGLGKGGVKQTVGVDPFQIQVDGGINDTTGAMCIEAGANVLVAGTYLFETLDMSNRIKELRSSF